MLVRRKKRPSGCSARVVADLEDRAVDLVEMHEIVAHLVCAVDHRSQLEHPKAAAVLTDAFLRVKWSAAGRKDDSGGGQTRRSAPSTRAKEIRTPTSVARLIERHEAGTSRRAAGAIAACTLRGPLGGSTGCAGGRQRQTVVSVISLVRSFHRIRGALQPMPKRATRHPGAATSKL